MPERVLWLIVHVRRHRGNNLAGWSVGGYDLGMDGENDKAMKEVWRGPARSYDSREVTFIVSADPNEPELHVQTVAGDRAERLGKGAYLFMGKQYETDDVDAP